VPTMKFKAISEVEFEANSTRALEAALPRGLEQNPIRLEHIRLS
jgi:hypothetical protein